MSEINLESLALAAIDRKIAHYRRAQEDAENRSGDDMWAEIAAQRDHTATALEYLKADILAAAPEGDMITPPEPASACTCGFARPGERYSIASDSFYTASYSRPARSYATPPEPVGVTREAVMALVLKHAGDSDIFNGDSCDAGPGYVILDGPVDIGGLADAIIALAKTEGTDACDGRKHDVSISDGK